MNSPSPTLTSVDTKVKLSVSAIARKGEYGAVIGLAKKYDVSRTTVYNWMQIALAILIGHFKPLPADEQLLAYIKVDKDRITRAVISAYVEGTNSMRSVQALVQSFYGLHISVGAIHKILTEAAHKAAVFNRSVSLEKIKTAALDELFSQGKPVLAGIDLDSKYLFLLEHRTTRSGEEWEAALNAHKKHGLMLEKVVKDAGTGLAAGVTKAFPDAQQRDDSFHAIYEMGKVQQRLEKTAWGAMIRQEKAEKKFDRACREGLNRRSLAQHLRSANSHFDKVVDLHDSFESLMKEAAEEMSFIGFDSLIPRRGAEQEAKIIDIADRMAALGGKKITSVATYLKNRAPGLASYMDDLADKLSILADKHGATVVGLCCQFWRCNQDLSRANRWNKSKHVQAANNIMVRIIHIAGKRASEITNEVLAIIERRHRASSAIEGFNARLRPYLYVHKRVSQGFLDLFAAWRNLRTRPMGKHRGTSAYELITGDKVDDWLSILGYPPPKAA